jgi:hypothetical protein
MLNDQFQHDLIEIGAMISTRAFGDVHNVLRGRIITVIAPIDMKTRRVEVRIGGTKRQALRSGGRNERVECSDPIGIEGIESAAQGIIVELCG